MDLLSFLGLVVLGYVVSVGVHEAGHAVCGNLVGVPVRLATLGIGPVVLSGRMGETAWELRLIPFSGKAMPYPTLDARRIPFLIFYLGGILANALACAAMLFFIRFDETALRDCVLAFAWAQFATGLAALLPRKWKERTSDGLLILRLLRHPTFGRTAQGVAYAKCLTGYGIEIASARFSNASVRTCHFWAMAHGSDVGERAAARRALLRELARGCLSLAEQLLVLDFLIGRALETAEPGLDPELDIYSSRAMELGSAIPTIRGSRGAALVELGRPAEAAELLRPLAVGPPSLDATLSRLYLARAEQALGNAAEAKRLLGEVERMGSIDSGGPLAAKAFARAVTEVVGGDRALSVQTV